MVAMLDGGSDLALGAYHGAFPEQLVGSPDSVAEEIDASTDGSRLPFADGESQLLLGKGLNPKKGFSKVIHVMTQDDDVIHVPRPIPLLKVKVDKPIHCPAVDVGKKLRGEASNR